MSIIASVTLYYLFTYISLYYDQRHMVIKVA